jgi:hypothetical protein
VTTTGSRHLTIGLLIALGLLVSLLLAFAVSPFASSSPDGLEKVAADKAIDRDEQDHAFADGPLAGYSVERVDDERLSTGVAGVVGVAATFAVGGCLFLVLRRTGHRRNDSAPDVSVVSTSSSGGGP